ncbi:hypothetical protein Kpol_1060p24 [Vanderwaltozyma polyspora DSM 70294]|uniref:Uncharacterized protein n=1 Tax=Vanderwaltozyma polyspora (strain ATCC 22028 / DSM 70294 / BCRC 21397 / CBS 2163 / NBRC 10782 / NRRL Y-8283 / UCD 57-17) TaxID=436907 RepID=A7TK22_VANPO|nr:uncharacterized protein Kpol_1060p24 [Vanderwaltozyma polyspora DSM 70294]EDO17368.1 hypothetical protein Kpol_1060p24 [Vanderwaltozyma polyspora DSM 70294]
MDPYRTQKRSSISFGSYHRQNNQNSYFTTQQFPGGSNVFQPNSGGGGGGTLNSPSSTYSTSRSPMYSPLNYSQPMLQGGYSQLNQFRGPTSMGTTSNSAVCEFESPRPLYALDWSSDDNVCLGSYKEDTLNKLQVIHSSDMLSWDKVAEHNIIYPVSNIQWLPSVQQPRKFATSSDSLRIWSLNEEDSSLTEQVNLSLCKYNDQHHSLSKNTTSSSDILGQFPPVTSFHWNPIDTNLLISSSIDTTCIVWDLQSSNYVRTQLIAHDSEVFDVKFLAHSTQLFASCGGDGSVRVFDLRSLAHSTIIYESNSDQNGSDTLTDNEKSPSALLRLQPSPSDPNVMATFALDSKSILILDMRNPGSPVLTLEGHSAAVNQIKWHPKKSNVLLSCGDDCQVLYWDLNEWLSPTSLSANENKVNANDGPISGQQINAPVSQWNQSNVQNVLDVPAMCYSNRQQEINNIAWRPHGGDWFGCVSGKKFQNVRAVV